LAALSEAGRTFGSSIRTAFAKSRLKPARLSGAWSSHYPADGRFRIFLFDDIASRPAETLQAILGFVGADLSKPGQLPPDHNPKSKARKMQMPGTIRDILIEYLADDVRECTSLLGGAASGWPLLYRL
jgi:hypothetical protein